MMTAPSSLLLLAALTLLAAGADAAVYLVVSHDYAEHGHLFMPPELVALPLGLTVLSVGCWVVMWRRWCRRRANYGRAPRRKARAKESLNESNS